jgi:hypothetical protein
MTRFSKGHRERLNPLFDEAFELAHEARVAWLREQRQSDPSIAAELAALFEREAELEREGLPGPGAGTERPDATLGSEE